MNRKNLIVLMSTIIVFLVMFAYGFYVLLTPEKTETEVVFWTLQMSDFSPYIKDVIKDFESQYPNIKIKWVDIPFSEGEKRTLAAVLSNNPPDIVNLNPDFSNTLARKGALFEIPYGFTRQFSQKIVNTLEVDGKIYSIPWYATSSVTIYNKKLLGDKIPETYSQVAEFAPEIKKNSNAYIMLPNITENDVMLKILNKYGVVGVNDINSAKSREVFDMFGNLYKNNLIPKETMTMTLRESLEQYMAGNIALLNAGPNFLNMIKENAPEVYKNTDVAPQIIGDLGQNDFSLMNFVIPEKAKNKKQAIKFVLFLTNDENQYKFAKLTNTLATNYRTLQRNFYLKYDDDDLIGKARVISASQLNNIQPVFETTPNQKEINNLVNSAVQEVLLGKGSTQKILSKVSKKWKRLEGK